MLMVMVMMMMMMMMMIMVKIMIPNNLLRRGSWRVLGTAQGGLDNVVDDGEDDYDDYGGDHDPKQHAEARSGQS